MSDNSFDYVLDCSDCGKMYVFGTCEEREAEMANHTEHDFDYFKQGRL